MKMKIWKTCRTLNQKKILKNYLAKNYQKFPLYLKLKK